MWIIHQNNRIIIDPLLPCYAHISFISPKTEKTSHGYRNFKDNKDNRYTKKFSLINENKIFAKKFLIDLNDVVCDVF